MAMFLMAVIKYVFKGANLVLFFNFYVLFTTIIKNLNQLIIKPLQNTGYTSKFPNIYK
ncbi:hypothetical protein Y10_21940 [Neptunitalea sp. Y10]|uniref:Uncharacterized protein n=1 Tax=Neptunitalea lumnitzerae TaxID=2965509 RepID=A0ABQ5MKI5_9FLAO|nr:hypothetical protein Y10_21940 [Neptunitalea sp. Y10]